MPSEAGHGAEGFDVSPDGREIWAANAQEATVTIIDVAAEKATQTLAVPIRGANRLKFTPDGGWVLISGLGAGPNAGGSSLVVMDASTRTEVKELNLGGGAAGILVAADGTRAYRAISTSDKVVVVDLRTPEVHVNKKHVPGLQGVRGRNSDNSRLKEVLRWEPQISLEEGLSRTYLWIEKQVRDAALEYSFGVATFPLPPGSKEP